MVLEKEGSTEQIRDETGAEDPASETVLDFLWDAEGPQDHPVGDQVQHAPAPNERASMRSHQNSPHQNGAGQDRPSTDELKDVLDRYASWLNSWSGHD